MDGKVISVDAKNKKLVIAHKDIPGLMKAMTMDYKVNDDWVFRAAKPGDHITASLVWIPKALSRKGPADFDGNDAEASTSPLHEPQPGDQPPDLAFENQDGKKVKLSDFFMASRCCSPSSTRGVRCPTTAFA